MRHVISIHNTVVEGKQTNSVSKLFASAIRNIPTDRKKLEIFEGLSFLKCLEIWHNGELFAQFVNEERSKYRGIDFFASSNEDENGSQAFQLVEYKSKYTPVANTEEFAEWLIKKNLPKATKKYIYLLIFCSKIRQS